MISALGALLVLAIVARGAPDPTPREELFHARVTATSTPERSARAEYVLRAGVVHDRRELNGMAVRTVRLGEFESWSVVRPHRVRSSTVIDDGGRPLPRVEGRVSIGTRLDVALVPGRRSNGVVTLAYHLEESDRRESTARVHVGAGDPTRTTTITATHLDRVVATGVRDVWLGRWTALAEVPDADGAPQTLYVTIDRVAPSDDPSVHPLDAATGLAPLAALGRDEMAPRGVLRITPIVRGAGPTSDDTPLTTLQVDGTLIRGVALARLLDETYLMDYDVEVAQCDFIADPIVGIQSSGIRAEVVGAGRLRLTWTTTSDWEWFETTLGAFTEPVGVELPDTMQHVATLAIEPGRRVVPMACLEDGRSLAVVVEFDPAR